MTRLWRRGRVWTLLAIGAAVIVLATWAFQRTGLSWITIAVVAIAATCVAVMLYLWWMSNQASRSLDDLGSPRPKKPKTRQP
jgi:flagellar basal body-associated protein FliL